MKSSTTPSIPRALRTALIIISIPFILQYLFRALVHDALPRDEAAPVLSNPPAAEEPQNGTVWDLLKSDERVSRFTEIVNMFPDIVEGLEAPMAKFTVFAPVNEAFASEFFPTDLPWFYWKFLAGYHMGPGTVSEIGLRAAGTVSSFVNADIFFTYKQRISTQLHNGRVTLNHEAAHIPAGEKNPAAVNGYVHRIDALLPLPNSTAHVLRTRPSLSTLRSALYQSGLSDGVNETNAHVAQTLFAPSNAAFDALGARARRFLFSRGGRPYLRALLAAHVVANRTLFSDVYFAHGGAALVDLRAELALQRDSSAPNPLVQIQLPTLHPGLNLSAIVRAGPGAGRPRLSVAVSGGTALEADRPEVGVVVPDIVVMDGVVHELDSLILPPVPAPQGQKVGHRTVWGWLEGKLRRREMGVEELMERLEPWVALEE